MPFHLARVRPMTEMSRVPKAFAGHSVDQFFNLLPHRWRQAAFQPTRLYRREDSLPNRGECGTQKGRIRAILGCQNRYV